MTEFNDKEFPQIWVVQGPAWCQTSALKEAASNRVGIWQHWEKNLKLANGFLLENKVDRFKNHSLVAESIAQWYDAYLAACLGPWVWPPELSPPSTSSSWNRGVLSFRGWLHYFYTKENWRNLSSLVPGSSQNRLSTGQDSFLKRNFGNEIKIDQSQGHEKGREEIRSEWGEQSWKAQEAVLRFLNTIQKTTEGALRS